MWLEESRVNHDGQVSMGPVVEGLEHHGKRCRLDALDSGEPFMVLEKRHSMIRAVFPGDELADGIDQRTETLLGGQA